MGANRLQGTPWHPEQFHRSDEDDRRYKGRCKYYKDDTGQCSYRFEKCIGSAHCLNYVAMTEEEFRKKQTNNQAKKSKKKIGEDDCYWY